jgi:16S rRNA (guanine527-N7)-methyltransferase
MSREFIKEGLEQAGIPVSSRLISLGERYLELLTKWNRSVRLVGRLDMEELALFHLTEGYWVACRFIEPHQQVVDIGSGNGFPGIAIGIYHPDVRLILLERSRRKAVFLEEAVAQLGLNATIVCSDAKDWHSWDCAERATLRAVRPRPALWETLRQAGVELVHLRGRRSPTFPAGWILLRRETFPLASGRVCDLLAPHMFHVEHLSQDGRT